MDGLTIIFAAWAILTTAGLAWSLREWDKAITLLRDALDGWKESDDAMAKECDKSRPVWRGYPHDSESARRAITETLMNIQGHKLVHITVEEN